jgi:hypothetical protein
MTAEAENDDLKVQIHASSIQGIHKDSGDSVSSIQGDILFKFKR